MAKNEFDADVQRMTETDRQLAERFNPPVVEEKRGPGRPRKEVIESASDPRHGAEVWVQAICAAMISKQVAHAAHVEGIVPIADAVLEAYKIRFPIK
jgi:hypothetical protein